MKTEELIVQLVGRAGPVQVLPGPAVRLARWAGAAVAVAAATIVIIGIRVDAGSVITQPGFAGLAIATLLTGLLSAAAAFLLSVPGAERSPLVRVGAIAAGAIWLALLAARLLNGGDAWQRIAAMPVHAGCVLEIVGVSLLIGWPLFVMLGKAAPLRPAWSAALAGLAAASMGAVAAQFICPIDDAAHQLVGHVLPALAVVGVAALARRRL